MEIQSKAIKITAEEGGKTVGRAFVYLIYNDLHAEPYGYLEDVFVGESRRGQGIGEKLVKEAIATARENKCYKLVGTSRNERTGVHEFYKKLGFADYGKEFRMDLK